MEAGMGGIPPPVRRVFGGSAFVLALLSGLLVGIVAIWVDPQGRTTLTDREEPPVAGAERVEVDDLAERWREEGVTGPVVRESDTSGEGARVAREVRVVLQDLARGNTTAAVPVLRRLHREHPELAEVSLTLAEIERRRGRLEAAKRILEEILTNASALGGPWEPRVRTLLDEVVQEIEVASLEGGEDLRREVETPHFRLTYDHRLAGRAYGERLIRLLDETRVRLSRSLGRSLSRPLDVHLYTRSQYLDAYRHRFGFATVGFYDGAIHAVTARHPRLELLALITHEYTHALFRDALGSDQPFFLNEGIAEREEAQVRDRPELVRGEWWKLVDAIRSDEWITLDRLVPGFGGLHGEQALLAYLESRASVEVLEARHPGVIGRWLSRTARGDPWELALVEETGWSVRALDGEVRRESLARFPDDPLRAAAGPGGQ
jgi:hypothetical protein